MGLQMGKVGRGRYRYGPTLITVTQPKWGTSPHWRKWGHFGDPSDAQDFPQNPEKSRATYRRLEGPHLNTNRGGVGPILGIASSPPPEALNFAINLSNP